MLISFRRQKGTVWTKRPHKDKNKKNTLRQNTWDYTKNDTDSSEKAINAKEDKPKKKVSRTAFSSLKTNEGDFPDQRRRDWDIGTNIKMVDIRQFFGNSKGSKGSKVSITDVVVSLDWSTNTFLFPFYRDLQRPSSKHHPRNQN